MHSACSMPYVRTEKLRVLSLIPILAREPDYKLVVSGRCIESAGVYRLAMCHLAGRRILYILCKLREREYNLKKKNSATSWDSNPNTSQMLLPLGHGRGARSRSSSAHAIPAVLSHVKERTETAGIRVL